jgi:fructose-bisphosphate aldolase, class I
MSLGKTIRLNRLFAHPSGRLCSIAVDHFIGYGQEMPAGLRHIVPTLAAIMAAKPDAVTMHRGIATSCWTPYAGQVPLILQSSLGTVEGQREQLIITPEDAVRLGADAMACAVFIRGPQEANILSGVYEVVREAERFDLPIICHIYPRKLDGAPRVSFEPDDIAWAVRCAVECGVDVVKAPYCGDVQAQAKIVADCPVPLVAAGGPRSSSLQAALAMMADVIASGTRGATIGRNVWGFERIADAVRAFKAVIHDGITREEAMRLITANEPVLA